MWLSLLLTLFGEEVGCRSGTGALALTRPIAFTILVPASQPGPGTGSPRNKAGSR
jgi:hypothetical protein